MRRIGSFIVTHAQQGVGARSAIGGARGLALRWATSLVPMLLPVNALAGPNVEFDIAPTAECRDITPAERLAQYPSLRLIEVSLPVSVRFRGVSIDDVDELAIE